MIYLLLISFIVSAIVLEKEKLNNPKGLIGSAINRCDIATRLIFYAMPIVSDLYLVILFIERKKPSWLVEIDWNEHSGWTIY